MAFAWQIWNHEEEDDDDDGDDDDDDWRRLEDLQDEKINNLEGDKNFIVDLYLFALFP